MIARQLYQEVILDHNRKPRHFGPLASANRRAEGINPLCGDHLHVEVALEGDTIADIGFTGDSCAICRASASMMTIAVKGRTVSEAAVLSADFRALAKGPAGAEEARRLGRLAVFAGIAELPNRVKCAVLPWHTLTAALQGEASATTEPEAP